MAAEYRHNYHAFRRHVLKAGWMGAAMKVRGQTVKATAEALAPVYTGKYKSSFVVSTHHRADRVVARVTNTAPYASAVEFGWGGTPKYRCLGRALHAAGG